MALKKKVKVFDPGNTTIIWGPVLFDGFGQDDMVTITQEEDDTSDEAGVDGEVTIVKSNDTRTTVEVVLAQTSDTNGQLSTIRNIGLKSPSMEGAILPMVIKDLNGETAVEGDNTWISKPPDRTLGKTPNSITWTFRMAHVDRSDGGIPSVL